MSSIVSTPLGKMAKTTSPTKKPPGTQLGRGGPAMGPGTPTGKHGWTDGWTGAC